MKSCPWDSLNFKQEYHMLGSAWLGRRLAEKDLGDHLSGQPAEHESALCLGSSDCSALFGIH